MGLATLVDFSIVKIAHFITTIARGGAENQLLILVKKQIQTGHLVTVFPLKDQLELYVDFESLGAKVDTSLHNRTFLTQMLITRKSWIRDFDVIHCHLPLAELLLAVSGQRYIVSRHYGREFLPGGGSVISRVLGKIASRNAFCTIAISESVCKWLLKSGELSCKTEVVVVPYGFEVKRQDGIKSINSNKTGKRQSTTFGVFARLSEEKDLPTVIRAFSLLKSEPIRADFSFALQIYGDGPDRNKLIELCYKNNVAPNRTLMGRINNPLEVMSEIDVVIICSKFEGFGMVYLEAMSLGKPILASKIDTAIEVLGEEGSALFFELGNSLHLARLMSTWRELLPIDYRKFQKSRLELFDADLMARRVTDLYLRFAYLKSKI